jgi:DNA-binding transcriptional LysR family regulator
VEFHDLSHLGLRFGDEISPAGLHAGARPVQISMSPAFAVEWLMPRIVEFQYQHPEITLMLNPTAEVVELKPGGIDIVIRYRDRVSPDATAVLISHMVVICADGHASIPAPGGVLGHALAAGTRHQRSSGLDGTPRRPAG